MYNPDGIIDKYLLDDSICQFDPEVAVVGQFEKYFIYVHGNESNGHSLSVPHFHIWHTNMKDLHAAIRIDCAKYYCNPCKKDRLNTGLKKELIAFLKAPYRNRGISVWEHLIDTWNDNNSNVILPYDLHMPNYL